MIKKLAIFVFVLIMTLSICLPTGAAAVSDQVSVMFTYIQYHNNEMSINSSGLASMLSEVDCYSGTVNVIVMRNYLQRFIDGTWTNLNSWAQTTYDNSATWSKGYYVYKGYSYRLRTYYYIYEGSTLLESYSATCAPQYY